MITLLRNETTGQRVVYGHPKLFLYCDVPLTSWDVLIRSSRSIPWGALPTSNFISEAEALAFVEGILGDEVHLETAEELAKRQG